MQKLQPVPNGDGSRVTRHWLRPLIAGISLIALFVVLSFVPYFRPLKAPELLVKTIKTIGGQSDSYARTVASVALRVAAITLLGILTSVGLSRVSARVALPLGMILAPTLAVMSQWINYGYFPLPIQLTVSSISALLGTLIGFTLRLGRFVLGMLAVYVVVVTAFFFWETSTNVTQDLDIASQQTVNYVLAHADKIRAGNDGFADAVQLAFTYVVENSPHGDPIQANKAAVLALGIIFGDESIAQVAHSEFEPVWRERIELLRRRVTLRNRSDSPRHFWVSAALTVIMDESRATTVGYGKELLDAKPGGSGFSFADLAANRAGILLALAATRDASSAKATQMLIIQGGLHGDDYCPEIKDLPEGLPRDQFQKEYGGLGGKLTNFFLTEIDRRMSEKAVLRFGK